MIEILGIRQKELLTLLMKNKSGLTADELSEQLLISRNAVRQHLSALENMKLINKGLTRASGGRPEQLYMLSETGSELFPRQYSWFAQLLVESIQQESGTDGLSTKLSALGTKVGKQLLEQNPILNSIQEKIQKLTEIMAQIGYSTKNKTTENEHIIEADNCIFHTLAMKNPEICQFDLALLSTFTGSAVEHLECMSKSGNVCRFKFNK